MLLFLLEQPVLFSEFGQLSLVLLDLSLALNNFLVALLEVGVSEHQLLLLDLQQVLKLAQLLIQGSQAVIASFL